MGSAAGSSGSGAGPLSDSQSGWGAGPASGGEAIFPWDDPVLAGNSAEGGLLAAAEGSGASGGGALGSGGQPAGLEEAEGIWGDELDSLPPGWGDGALGVADGAEGAELAGWGDSLLHGGAGGADAGWGDELGVAADAAGAGLRGAAGARDDASLSAAAMRVPVVDASLSAPSAALIQREVELEEEAVRASTDDARAVQDSVVTLERGMELAPMRRLEQEWLTALVTAIDKEQAALLGRAAEGGSRVSAGAAAGAVPGADSSVGSAVSQSVAPYMLLLPPDKLAVITMHTVLNLLLARGGTAPATGLMTRVGAMVESEVNVSRLQGRDRRAWERMQGAMDAKKLVTLRRRCRDALEDADWPAPVKAKLGAALLKCLVDTVAVRVPAGQIDAARIEWFAANTASGARPFVTYEGLAGHLRLDEAMERVAARMSPEERIRVGIDGAEAPPDPSADADADGSGSGSGATLAEADPKVAARKRMLEADAARRARLAELGSRDDSISFPGLVAPEAVPVPAAAGDEAAAEEASADLASTSESDMELERDALAWDEAGATSAAGAEQQQQQSVRERALLADSGHDRAAVSGRLAAHGGAEAGGESDGLDAADLPSGACASSASAAVEAAAERDAPGSAPARVRGVALSSLHHAVRYLRFGLQGNRACAKPALGPEAGYDGSWIQSLFPLPSATELRSLDALRYPGKHLADAGQRFAAADDAMATLDPESAASAEVAAESAAASAEAADEDLAHAPPGSHVEMPALVHSYAWAPKRGRSNAGSEGGRQAAVGVIRLHPRVLALLAEAGPSPNRQLFYPMLVPPRRWQSPDSGGYVLQRARLMRTKGSRAQSRVLREASMPSVFKSLDILGGVAWRMNTKVRDVVRGVWESGGGIADIPSLSDHAEPPPPRIDPEDDEETARNKLRAWRRLANRVQQWNRNLHSLRCDHKLKMEVVDRFVDDVVYFPHNLDFRGRVYPVPPHLNHMGADICRGLLVFAERKRLGADGLRWLKIHLANKMGRDKVSFVEREQYVEDNLAEVFDSADNPLTGNGWWLSADSPWQALATCIELAEALRSPSPEDFLSSVPVHQDGTCNGLQHYAALGRDLGGAKAVNLVKADKPQDVYSAVLDLVVQRIELDATLPEVPEPGTPDDELEDYDSRRRCAAFVRGHVVRKTIKQTVMTSVYGVTFIGARDQIRNRLRETFEPRREELGLSPDELDDIVYKSAAYLARTTLDSLGQMFEAADAIKTWLTQAARLVSSSNQPMAWITPLGLPVVQPYRRNSSQVVSTVMQQVVLASENDALPVSSQKQGSAFPPNYVHSLDSTHMMLTGLECARRGMVFTAVHDSYWTHASDIDAMNIALRDAFVRLYEMPLLEDLRESLVLRFPGLRFPELPARGTLDLSVVRDSPYFFN
ncbi:hypothetical protein FNF31_06081 [Cafeteria roenbergensis]|uniref:DNA-directed RNA polymerase n=2 Tax=Cafeteria roenbergensis TaxID=33653 RepID=A0A5A8CR23_CAFRO|nr:hypothetical protein FNF31_06081 [Cafeteria roenbergensis]